MALATKAKQRLADTFGTAPHRVSPGVWQTRTGRVLGPAASAYWEHAFRAGRFDATGHRTTPSVINQINNADVTARQPKTPTVKPGRAGGGDFSSSRPEIQTAHKQAVAWAKEISKTQLTPEDLAQLQTAGVNPGPFMRDLSSIITGAPRAAWVTGKAIGNLPFEVTSNAARGKFKSPSLVTDVLEPLGQSYNKKYVEPTRKGDLGQLWRNIKETPVSSLLDASLLAGGATTAAVRAGRFAGAEGGISARMVASRQQPPRLIRTGETTVEIPQSPNELAAIIQRRVLDPLSERAQRSWNASIANEQIPVVPAAMTSDVRAAKQTFRDMTQQMRRVRSLHAQEMRDVKAVPRGARTRAWYEFQLPEGIGTEQVAEHLDQLAHQTLDEGTASARLQASKPTNALTQALAHRDRVANLLKRAQNREFEALRSKAGEALRARKETTATKTPVSQPVMPPPKGESVAEAETAAGKRPVTTDAPIEQVKARFDKVDAEFERFVKSASKGLTTIFTNEEKQGLYGARSEFNKQNRPETRGHGRRYFRQSKPKTPGEHARDLAIERLHKLAAAPGDEPWRVHLRNLIAEHDDLSSRLMRHEEFTDLGPIQQVSEPVKPSPAAVEAQRIVKKLVPTMRPKPAEGITTADLKGALAVANDRVRRLEKPRPPKRNPEAEAAEARALLEKAAKARESGKHTYDPKAKDAARTLMEARKDIFVEAGKLNPEEAANIEGSFARELGVEPSGSEVYMHHGVKRQRRGFGVFGGPRTVEGAAKTPPGIGQQRQMLAFRSGRVLTDSREVIRAFDQSQAYHFNNMLRHYLGKVGQVIPDGAKPHKGWYVINEEGQHVPRAFKDASPEAIAHAEGISIDKALERDIKDYVDNYIAKAGTKEGDELAANAAKQGVRLRQVPPEVVHKLINPRNVTHSQSTLGYVGSAASDIVRASLIYANPGYVPANLIGNFGFLVTHQGAKAPVNMGRAAGALLAKGIRGTLTKEERGRLRDLLRAEVGMGPTVSVLSGGKGIVQQGIAHLARAEGLVADDWMRLADWIGEARKQGVKTPEQQLEFLTAAAKGDEKAVALANRIKARMEEAMVSFDRLGPRERDYASKFLFVWPWIRGASRYPLTLARDMPVRAALGARAAENAANDESMDAPPRPEWLSSAFKVGPGKYVAARAASTVSTPLEEAQLIADALTGKNNKALLDIANPLVRLGADVGTGKNRFGQNLGALGVLKQEGAQLSPAANTIEELLNPSASPKVFGKQTPLDVVKRRFGRGLIPFSLDEREAYKEARKTMGQDERWKYDTEYLAADYQKALPNADPKLKEKLDAAIGWQHYRAVERLKFYKAHAGDKVDPTDPKNPTALNKLKADLAILKKLGRISQQKADAIYATAYRVKDDPLRRSHIARDIAYLGVHYFYSDAFSQADHQIKKAGADPPRRLALP